MGACGIGATSGSCKEELDVLAVDTGYHSCKDGFDVLGDRGTSSSCREEFDFLVNGFAKSTGPGVVEGCFGDSDVGSVTT